LGPVSFGGGFVIMKKGGAEAPTASNMPMPRHRMRVFRWTSGNCV
jgi:hypothetical protein